MLSLGARPRVSVTGLRWLLWSVLSAACPSLAAEDAAGSGPVPGDSSTEEIQVTATRLPSAASAVPMAVEIVDEEAIRRHAPEVLPDALRGEPSVHLQLTTPGQGSPFVRGLTGSSILNLVDGMRLNHAIYRNSPNPYLALVDPWLVQRIEILRGPASVLYGSDAMGGVIQVLSRRPVFGGDERDARGRIASRFASADLSASTRAEVEAGDERVGLGAGFSYLAAGDLDGGGDVGRQEPTAYTSIGGDVRSDLRWNGRHTSSLDFQILRQPKSPRYDELVPGFGRDAPPNDAFWFEPLERYFLHARHDVADLAPGVVDRLRFDGSYQHVRDDQRTRAFESTTERLEENATGLVGVAAQGVTFVSDHTSLVWGGDLYLDRVSSARHDRDLETGAVEEATSRYPDGSRMDSYGLYLEGTQALWETLSATAGLRFSHFDVRIARTATTDAEVLSFDDVTGAVGLTWEAGPGIHLVTDAGRGFRAPNVFDIGTLGPRPGNRFNVPASTLDAEQVWTVDVGVKAERERVAGAVFLFGSLYEDRIESVRTGELTEDGREITRSENVAEVRLAGVESHGRVGLTSDVSIDAHLTWTWGEQEGRDGDLQPADRIPPILGRVSLTWEATESLWVEPFVRFAGPQDRLSDDNQADPRIDPSGTPGWVTGNIVAGWDFDPRFTATLAIENFTDAEYREHGSGVVAPGIDVIVALDARF